MKQQRPTPLILSALLVLLLVTSASALKQPTRIADVPRITPAELQQLRSNQAVTVIDTRTPGQWHRDQQKVQGALRFTFSDDMKTLKAEIPLNQTIVTYCT